LCTKIIEICVEKHIQISTVQNSPRSKQPRSPLPASSAASERLFSISGWHCADRKDRLDKQHLAAKTFLSCNKDLLRDNLFN